MLDRLYCALDSLTSKYNLFKVETIGDAYLVVGNLRHPQHDHAAQVARFAMEAVKAATSILANEDDLDMGYVACAVIAGTYPMTKTYTLLLL